jgi:hypothetical protein
MEAETQKLNKEELGYFLHLLSEEYRLAGSRGYTRPQINRIIQYSKKVEEMWLNYEEEN